MSNLLPDPGIQIDGNAPSEFGSSNSYETVAPAINSVSGMGGLSNYLGSLATGNSDTLGTNFLGSGTNSILGGFGSLFDNPNFAVNGQSSLLNPTSSTSSTSTSAASSSFWSDLFLRAVVIFLGFIFTAIGLTMFSGKGNVSIENVISGAGKAAGSVGKTAGKTLVPR